MDKQIGIIAFWVIISIGLAAFFIPAVSADGEVYTEASVNPDVIELGETTTVTLHAVTTAPTAGGAYHMLPVGVEYVEGSASAEPIVNGQTLEWIIGNLIPGVSWNVTFDVKPLNLGNLSVNVVPDSEVANGKVTGGGCEIPSPENHDKKANFGFNTQYKDGETEPFGSLQFTDHATGMKVHSESINTLTVSETNATFTGTAKVDGTSGYTFTVYVEDNGEPGKGADKFAITIRDSGGDITYSADDTLEGGNIKIHDSSVSVPFPDVFVEVKAPTPTPTPNQPPVAVFTVSNSTPATNQSVVFDASESRDSDGEIVARRWDFDGDGTWDIEGNYVEISHCYGEEETYQVKLEVEDNDGLKDNTTKEINVSGEGGAQEISGNVTLVGPLNLSVPSEKQTIGQPIEITGDAVVSNTGLPTNVSIGVYVDGYLIGQSVSPLPNTGGAPISVSTTWIPMSSGRHSISVQVRELKADGKELWISPTNDPTTDKTIFIEKVRGE